MNIKIEWLTDDYDCDICGNSFAEGAKVYFDNELVLDLEPLASCFGGQSYSTEEVFAMILDKIGHTVEYVHSYE